MKFSIIIIPLLLIFSFLNGQKIFKVTGISGVAKIDSENSPTVARELAILIAKENALKIVKIAGRILDYKITESTTFRDNTDLKIRVLIDATIVETDNEIEQVEFVNDKKPFLGDKNQSAITKDTITKKYGLIKENITILNILDYISLSTSSSIIKFVFNNKEFETELVNFESFFKIISGYTQYEYYSKTEIERADKQDTLWQSYWLNIYTKNLNLFNKKGEFEKTFEYESRVDLQTKLKRSTYNEFKKNRSELVFKIELEKENSKENTISKSIKPVKYSIYNISDYNADNESFIFSYKDDSNIIYNDSIIIPIKEAPDFKNNYRNYTLDGYTMLTNSLKSTKAVNLMIKTNNEKYYKIGEQLDLSKFKISALKNPITVLTKISKAPKLNTAILFQEDNGNKFLDGDEKSFIKLTIRNEGEGLAQGVNIKMQVNNSLAIEFKSDNYIGQIEPKSEKSVTIPVRALESITSGTRNFKLLINEANGFNPSPIELTISTKELIKPSLKLSEVGIENTITKLPILKQSETSTVTFRVQNNSKADAKNLVFNIQIPNNVFLLGGNKRIEIAELKAGSILDIPIDIIPNNLANASGEFKISYTGKYLNGTFSKNLSIESNTVASNKVVISGKEETSINYNEVITADLNIDIENNIPINKNINKNAIAVVLGIEKYKNVGNVSFASRDASIVKEYFNKALGIPVENIYFKLNGDVTKGEMEKIFGGWIKNRVDANTNVYIYYAGHGAPSTDQNAYLIPNDGDPNYAEETGYSLNKMYDQLEKLPTDNITVFLDACFSGQDREQKLLIKDARGLGIKTKTSSIPDKLNVFSASSNDQVSSGWPDKKHGLFTYYMLKGIQGNADNNNDKQVSYEELSNYIKLNVERQAGFLDRKQNPQSKIVNLNTFFK